MPVFLSPPAQFALPLAMLVVCGGPQYVAAKPCPDNAYFTFDNMHVEKNVCACDGGLSCVGSRCIMGNDNNFGSFVHGVHGFPITCLDCFCTTFAKNERQSQHSLLETTEGTWLCEAAELRSGSIMRQMGR